MERRKFVKNCCYSAVGLTSVGMLMQSCGSIYYATSSITANKLIVAKSEFWKVKKDKKVKRKFIMLNPDELTFPICIYEIKDNQYIASLLECTHRGCELNVGGGIYTCPCHGSEFSAEGKVLEGPADQDLKTFKIETDDENIYIYLS